MTSVNELVNRLTVEHPGVPRTAVQALLGNKAACAAFTAPGCTKQTLAEALQGSDDGNTVIDWISGLEDNQCDGVIQKLKIIATTNKLIGMLPAAMQGNVEKMIQATSAAHKPKPGATAASSEKNASSANNAAAAMDMLNNIMGSGFMEQMQDMAEGGDEEYEQMCTDVKQLKKEVKELRRLVQAIVKKLPDSKPSSKCKRSSKESK